MIHRVRHVARYAYDAPVERAAHLLRLRPRALPHQRVHAADVCLDPPASTLREGRDHYGNPVSWAFIDHPHARFEVAALSAVEVSAPDAPAPFTTPSWEAVTRAGAARFETAEFTFGSPLAPADGAARAYAAVSFPPGFPVLAGLLDLMGRIGRDVRLRPGAAVAGAEQALRCRAGACQDLAHLMIAGLRGLGLPARYVSGYARGRDAGQPHAWVEGWLGPEGGWIGLDPAGDCLAADGHVLLAWGRDDGDARPVQGTLVGGGAHTLRVSVEFDPEARAPATQ